LAARQSRSDAIARCPIFSGLGKRLLSHIAAAATERYLAPNQQLSAQGEPFAYLGVVARGSVLGIVSSKDGRDQILYEAGFGESFGETLVFGGEASLGRSAAGARGAVVVLIANATLEKACGANPVLGLQLARAIAQRAQIVANGLASLAFTSTKERVARAILALVRSVEDDWMDAPAELRELSQTQLAERSGTVRVVVARALRSLEEANAIELERGRIKRLNAAALARRV